MEKLSVLLCLLAVLNHCQAGSEVQLVELPHEDVAEIKEETVDQGLEASAPLESAADSDSEPNMDMDQKLEALEDTVIAQEETIRELEENDDQLIDSDDTLADDSRFDSHDDSDDHDDDDDVAFSVALSPGTYTSSNTRRSLVYRTVLTNIRRRYNSRTGVFTAPVRGVYYFTFTLHCSTRSRQICGGSLFRNEGQIVSSAGFSSSNPSSGSNSAILQLRAGDRVSVRLWRNAVITADSNRQSTFSGFLID